MFKKLLLGLAVIATLAFGTMVNTSSAQTMVTANQITATWDPVAVASGAVSYKTYYKPAAGGVETYVATLTAVQSTWTFTLEGRYYLGVKSVRTVDGVELESSTISWSNDPLACQGGVTFGIQYYNLPPNVGGIRVK